MKQKTQTEYLPLPFSHIKKTVFWTSRLIAVTQLWIQSLSLLSSFEKWLRLVKVISFKWSSSRSRSSLQTHRYLSYQSSLHSNPLLYLAKPASQIGKIIIFGKDADHIDKQAQHGFAKMIFSSSYSRWFFLYSPATELKSAILHICQVIPLSFILAFVAKVKQFHTSKCQLFINVVNYIF